mmetsp:Transcript_15942/g.38763  ORF Transcript_15942/g.38763 Transcript_15942/m.38763 type:complete len:121 (-) Transcript_15942:263-625(-)
MGIRTEVLGYNEEAEGAGARPQSGDTCACHFSIQLMDTTRVCDTRDEDGDTAGEPVRFKLGQGSVIAGLDQAILKMVVGQLMRVVVSPDLGYGSKGFYPSIPANATLIIDVELLSINSST